MDTQSESGKDAEETPAAINKQLQLKIAEHKQTEIALRESEQRYKLLLASVTDYIYTVKVEGNQPVATIHGPGCVAVTGYAQEDYKQDPYLWYQMIVDEDRTYAVNIIERLVSGDPVTPFEHRIKHKNGSIRWVRNTPVPRYNAAGELTAYDSLVSDITGRKMAEEALTQRNRELELLNRAGQAFISTLNLDEVLATILNEVRSLLNVIGCSAWLVDPVTNDLICKQVTDPQSAVMRGWRLSAGEGLAGWVAEHGESLNLSDALLDERHYTEVDRQTGLVIRSILTVPLIAKSRVIGVFQVVDETINRFSASDLTLVESLAATTAGAIEQARLYDNLRSSQEYIRNIIDSSLDMIITVDLERNIVEFNRAAQQCFGYQRQEVAGKHIDLLYEDAEEALGVHKIALKNGQTVQEVRNRRKDGRVFPSILSASVLRDTSGTLVGVMGISRDITFSKQAEVEREELLKLEHEQRLQLETLSEATLALTSQISHESVLDEILNQAQRLVPYTTANISLLKDNILRPVRWQGYDAFQCEESIANLVQPLQNFPIDAQVIESRMPQVIYDVQAVEGWVPIPETEWIRSSILVPICHYQRVLGLLRLDNHNPGKYTFEDAERLQPMANVAAIALRNAQLYQNAVLTAQTKLTLLNEVNHRVKNNLASIIGLLYTEMQNIQSHDQASYTRVMKNMINRVQGLATVHTILSASEWRPVKLSDLTQQIIHAALRTSASGKEVSVEIQPSPVKVSPEQAGNLALVLNELATNTAKQASNATPDMVQVVVRINLFGDTVRLEFRDNGAGYPETMLENISRHNNTGFKLIQNIVKRNLRGKLSLHNDHGAVTVLQFPTDNP